MTEIEYQQSRSRFEAWRQDPYNVRAFNFSLLGHLVLLYLMLEGLPGGHHLEPAIYSVSLESGKNIGGVSQVAKNEKKEPVAPPKAVEQKKPPPVKKQEEKKAPEQKKPETKKVEKAEVSLKEKEQRKKAETKKPVATPVKKAPEIDINKRFQQAMQRYTGESTDAGGKGFGAARTGGQGMGGGIRKSPEWFIYQDKLKAWIKQGWNWHDSSAELVAYVEFRMTREGFLSDVRLSQTSGNSTYDDSVMRAVLKASPVPPPPPDLYSDFAHIVIDFSPQ